MHPNPKKPAPTETDDQSRQVVKTIPVLRRVYPQTAESEQLAWIVDRPKEIGRSVDPVRAVCLAEDRKVSILHGRLIPRDDGVQIVDEDSKNHTFVDGLAASSGLLRDGSVVRVGHSLLVLRMERTGVTDAPRSATAVHQRLLGSSQEIKKLRHSLYLASKSVAPVLLMGPTGCGKELAARALHELSERRSGPFVAVNCAAIPRGAIESTLFGHRKGAFTGADRAHDGYFQQAHEGTLFLDELGELPLEVQATMLRTIQGVESSSSNRLSGAQSDTAGKSLFQLESFGGQSRSLVDVRIVTATNVDLQQAMLQGRFREDLFHRVAALPIRVPALRARRDDIICLCHHYLSPAGADRPTKRVTARLAELLLLHPFPGNVRELRNLCEQLLSHGKGSVFDLDDLPEEVLELLLTQQEQEALNSEGTMQDAADTKPHITRELLARLLDENRGNVSMVSRIVKRSPRQVARRIKELGLSKK